MKINPTKIDRSGAKWLPGAMALAATAASSQATVVQITLTGNKISSSGNHLVADLTVDGNDDVVISALNVYGGVGVKLKWKAGLSLGVVGNVYAAKRDVFYADAQFAIGGVGVNQASAPSLRSISYLNPRDFFGYADQRWFSYRWLVASERVQFQLVEPHGGTITPDL